MEAFHHYDSVYIVSYDIFPIPPDAPAVQYPVSTIA